MSREMTNKEAISNLNHIYGIVSPGIQRSLDLAIKALEERPKGKWVLNPDCNFKVVEPFYYLCDKCSCPSRSNNHNFCPNCGADMRKPNCVTCDHFGKCEGCERSGEE